MCTFVRPLNVCDHQNMLDLISMISVVSSCSGMFIPAFLTLSYLSGIFILFGCKKLLLLFSKWYSTTVNNYRLISVRSNVTKVF
jgi:hypothetical protein